MARTDTIIGPTPGSLADHRAGAHFRLAHRQDQRHRSHRRTPWFWYVGFGLIVSCLVLVLFYCIAALLTVGVGLFGINDPGGMGICDRQFRLVDRHRPRRHVDLGDSVAAAAKVAAVDQSFRRSDDPVRGRLRWIVSAASPGTPVVFLLAVSLSEHHGHPAAVSQPAGLGRVCGVHLLHRFVAVLVSRFDSRSGHPARSRARGGSPRFIYGMLAMGWRGSAIHWHRYEMAYLLLAGLATPLVISVHTVVSFDFAAALVPGWHSTIFPPYFVAGAIYSGFAMVLTIAIPLRRLYEPRRPDHRCAI